MDLDLRLELLLRASGDGARITYAMLAVYVASIFYQRWRRTICKFIRDGHRGPEPFEWTAFAVFLIAIATAVFQIGLFVILNQYVRPGHNKAALVLAFLSHVLLAAALGMVSFAAALRMVRYGAEKAARFCWRLIGASSVTYAAATAVSYYI